MKELSVTEYIQHDCYTRAEVERSRREMEAHFHWEALKKEDAKQPPLPFGLKRSTKIFLDVTPWLWAVGIVIVLWFLWSIVHQGQTKIAPSDCDISTACTDSR
jgi:hypothetical protein